MEFSTSSKKLIGRLLLNSEDERTGALQTIFETTEGKIEVIRHDGTLRAAWRRGDLEPGNVVTIDSLRSDASKLYAASVATDKDIRTTMNVYGGALDDTMREYNGKVVRMALQGLTDPARPLSY
jgi:hypothetical protein